MKNAYFDIGDFELKDGEFAPKEMIIRIGSQKNNFLFKPPQWYTTLEWNEK